MIYVIGSGPAGVSCAHAPVKMKLAVTMLDAGLELEPERQDVIHNLEQTPLDAWDPLAL